MTRAMYLAKKEWLSDEEVEMLGLAWLFHDTGFIIQYDDNEYIWAKIAQNYLKSILYSPEKINVVERMILATSLDYVPENIYEKIIKDADLDNLWRDDFTQKNNDLRKEIELVKNIKIKDPEWLHAAVELLKEHKFMTKSQIKEREEKRLDNLKKVKGELEQK
jgi:predicted metal-dependent HD superfamily phosphohydrolase